MILSKKNVASIDLDFLINDKIKNDKLESILIVVPTNRKLRILKKEIITLSSNKVTANINLETLSTLTKKILEQSSNFHELSEAASAVFIERSSQNVDLKYFTNYKGEIPSGTLERISNVISKYKEEGITPIILRKEAEKLSKSEKLKALDIANIYEKYNAKCYSLGAFELGDVYQNLVSLKFDQFSSYFRKLFKDIEFIVIYGFDEFTSLELSLLNKLSNIDKIKLFINFDYSAYNSMIFSHLENTYEQLQKHGFKKVIDKSKLNESHFIDAIKNELFLKTSNKNYKKFKDKLVCISAATREKEIEYIAKEIKQKLISGVAKPHEICVTFNLINNYSSIVRDIFHVYGIPFNLTDRIPLDQTLSVTAIISFLEILESDYYYNNIIRSLSNSLIEIENFDIDTFMFSAKNLKIIVGRENWNFNLNNAIKKIELNSEIENIIKVEKYRKTLESLKKIDILLHPFKKKLLPSDFIKELNLLIQRMKIAKKLLIVDNENKETDVKSLTTFLHSVEEIFFLLETEERNKKYSLTFYLDKIRMLSQSARFNIKEKSDYGVLVTNMDEIRGLKFKYTFLGGMIDGDFPTKYQPEIFFSGSFAKKELHHLNEERYRFYQALRSWDKALYLSYTESQGEMETVRSTFLEEFEKIFQMNYKSEDNYKSKLFSTEELQRNIKIKKFSIEKIDDFSFLSKLIEWEKAVRIDEIRKEDLLKPSPYKGNIFTDECNDDIILKEKLYDIQNKPYSISQLETYTTCPFKYFLERVLKIEVADEPDEEIEAVEIGSLLHTVLFEFYMEIRAKNIIIKNCTDAVFKIAEDLLFKIADKHFLETMKKSPFAFYEEEKIFGIKSKKENSLLYKFLMNERTNQTNRNPNYFEVSFGVKDNEHDQLLYSNDPLNFENIKLRGKIDRIDINRNEKTFEVIDYKSGGKKITKGEIEKGTSLQLPIYVWAVKTLLSNKLGEEYSPKAMTIYNLKYKENIFGKNTVSVGGRGSNFDPTPKLIDLVDQALNHIKESVENILDGNFPLTPFIDEKDKICRYCNFNTVCRVDELTK